MTKKKRMILFLSLTFLFFLIAPTVVFYSQGYRFNFETKKITQTGGFYFKVWPKNVNIYIAPIDKRKKTIIKKTDIFFGAAFIDNLLPKKYEIEIKKERYSPWRKTLEIKEQEVTAAKNIVLIPKNPEFTILAKKTGDFFFSPDQKKVILKEVSEKGWALKLLELEKNIKSHLIEDRVLSENSIEVILLDVKFSPDSKRVLLKIAADKTLKYLLFNLEENSKLWLDFLGKDIQDVFFHPENTQKIFFLKEGVILETDLPEKKISPSRLKNITAWQISNKDIYYLDNSGFLFKTDYSLLNGEKINKIPFPLEKEKEYEISIFPDKIFLQDKEKLFLFNPSSGSFEKFFETRKKLKIAPDFKKLLYFSDHEIWILFLKEEFGQPQKSVGEKVFVGRFSERIEEIFWLTSHYLIFNIGDKIKIAEIDDRDKINTIDIDNFKSPKIYWNKIHKKLFILSQGNFYGSEILIP